MKQQGGFTLIETMIAMVILAIGFTILVEGFTMISTAVEKKQDYFFLNSWSEDKLLEVINGIDHSQNGVVSYRNREYRWWIEQKYLNEQLQELELNVEWPGPKGFNHYQNSRLINSG